MLLLMIFFDNFSLSRDYGEPVHVDWDMYWETRHSAMNRKSYIH